MSGICGIIDFSKAPVAPEDLRSMAEAAAHRGPDGIHYWTKQCAGLANLRLDITPESRTEIQPLVLSDAGIVLTADARIDNRSELIRDLVSKGFLLPKEPEGPSDAELIGAAYLCWGAECPVHLLGDFAFVIWDRRGHRVFAARDPMAMRPLYYHSAAARLAFASELKQILQLPEVTAEIHEPAVGMHLAGLHSPLAWSFYRGILQLPPAHALSADADSCRTWRYWDIDPGFTIAYREENQYLEHFLEIFSEAMRCRLRSFKPVGILLSGGLDSGSAASMAGWLRENEKNRQYPAVHAFCWAFEELPQCDERHISSRIVDHFGFPHDLAFADDCWPLKDYPDHGPDPDDPYLGVYQALLDASMERARSRGVGVMLSGDRGDLTVGMGIWDYRHLFRLRRIRELKTALRGYVEHTGLPPSSFWRQYLVRPVLTRLWAPGYAEALRRGVRKALGRGYVDPPDWVRPEFVQRIGLQEIYEQAEHNPGIRDLSRLTRYRNVFMDMYMRGMVWSDRTNARFGIGFADPWSDLRLARFVLAIPQHVLNRPGEHKRLIREAMRGIMPEQAREGAAKISPEPLYVSAITSKARKTVRSLIRGSRAAARGFLDEDRLLEHYEGMCGGARDHPCFWWALTLEMWLRAYW